MAMIRQQLYLFIIFFVIICTLYSCEYDPNGVFEQQVESPSLPLHSEEGFSFYNKLINDTIYVHFYEFRMYYSCPEEGRRVMGARYSVNGGSMMELDKDFVRVELELYELNEGINTIRVELAFNSGTKSIADLSEVEFVSEVYEFKVFKIPMYSSIANTLSTSIEDGALKLSWRPYEYIDFDYYEILYTAHIKDQNQTYYYDENYYEGLNKGYELSVFAGGREVSTYTRRATYPLPPLWYEEEDGGYRFYWNKTKFPKADIKYVVGGMYSSTVWFESENLNDTSFFIKDLPFGRSLEFNLNFIGTGADYEDGMEGSKVTNIAVGETTPIEVINKNRFYNKETGQVVVYFNYNFAIYDESTNRVVKEAYINDYARSYFYGAPWALSQNGKKIVGVNSDYVLRLDPEALETERIISLQEFKEKAGLGYGYYFKRVIADEIGNYYIIISDYRSWYTLYRYNEHSEEVTQITMEENYGLSLSDSEVSADGKFIILNSGLCAIEGNTCSLVYGLGEGHFLPEEQTVLFFNNAVYNKKKEVRYLDLESMQIDEQLSFNIFQLDSYSLNFKYAIGTKNYYDQNPSIIDLETGKVLQELNVTDAYSICMLANSYIYGYAGRRMAVLE